MNRNENDGFKYVQELEKGKDVMELRLEIVKFRFIRRMYSATLNQWIFPLKEKQRRYPNTSIVKRVFRVRSLLLRIADWTDIYIFAEASYSLIYISLRA